MRARRPPAPRLPRLVSDRRGATAIEYGLIVALVVITMIVTFQMVASTTVSMWGNTSNKVAAAIGH